MRADWRAPEGRSIGVHPALVRGTVRAHAQHPDTRQWTLTVEVRGGKLIQNVAPLTEGGVVSGERKPLPPIGSRVLIGFAEPALGIDAFVIGGMDGYAVGLDHDDPGEAVSLSPAGLGRAVSPDGTLTTQWPGGDVLTAGPGAGYEFQVRDEKGRPFTPKFPVRALRILGDFTRGGLALGARLYGGMEVLADAARKTITLRATARDRLTIKPGVIRAETGMLLVGEREGMAASVARWPETEATLTALTRELQAVKHELVKLRARVVRTETQIEILSTHPQFVFFKPVIEAVPVIPLPLITPGGKDGALVPGVGGVQVVQAGTTTLVAE